MNAHPFTYSICKLYIGDQYISGNLEVSAENLIFFNYLHLDSNIRYTADEILEASEVYRSSLSESILIHSEGSVLKIEDFRLGELSLSDHISISELKETFIHYSFKIKLEQAIDHLDVTHSIGAEYPLISSLLILEVEGKEVKKSFDNLATNKLHTVSFNKKSNRNATRLLLEKGDVSALIKIHTTDDILKEALGGFGVLKENPGLLNELLIIKSNELVIPFSNVQFNRTADNGIEITAEVPIDSNVELIAEWKEFNTVLKSVPTIILTDKSKSEFTLSRYSRILRW
ncbi:hypothetical protein GCM10007940_33520 [Portibacter lacus]|uniref:Uncharacterized protein n=2 Tax=Portibacter lacus TaxID=1099794 RepID=A0AA37SQ03_9BACT|nr:hypothetical protein GCM10007940_33520 [Portibacter lacus]